MERELEELVTAAWKDLRQSYSTLTLEWLQAEAERILNGEKPRGGPSMFLEGYLRRAGFIKTAS